MKRTIKVYNTYFLLKAGPKVKVSLITFSDVNFI